MNTLVMTDPADLFDRLKAELAADFHGWDFSHLDGRMVEDPLPWQYSAILNRYLPAAQSLLDLGTGGGEFSLSAGRPPGAHLRHRRLPAQSGTGPPPPESTGHCGAPGQQ